MVQRQKLGDSPANDVTLDSRGRHRAHLTTFTLQSPKPALIANFCEVVTQSMLTSGSYAKKKYLKCLRQLL